MAGETGALPEETLDPQDWEEMRRLGHRMVDDMLDYLRSIRERPVWRNLPPEVRSHFRGAVPREPAPPEAVYQEFLEYVLPYPMGNAHPRFWGWVLANGTVLGALAEFLAAATNSNAGGGDYHSAYYVERQVVDWCKELLGYPVEASGVLTSGGSGSNLVGLAVARSAKAGYDVRREGVNADGRKLVLYASGEAHSSVQKAVELLGLGSEALRRIPAREDFGMDLTALEAAIAQDRRAGHHPFCVVGAAGTTDTGGFDDLSALADLCQAEGLWLHVDGAFGAWAALVPECRDLAPGMERADSLAFDLHKWMYLPYDIGCVLVRDEPAHRAAFSLMPAYLAHGGGGRGISGGESPWLSDYSHELSRGFRALKAWMSLKAHGSDKFARLVRQNVAQARYLADLVAASAELELVAPVTLNVVCFRYVAPGLDAAALEALNRQLLIELQEQGLVAPSGSTVRGKYVLHVAITNHRSRREDFDLLVRETIRLGRMLRGRPGTGG